MIEDQGQFYQEMDNKDFLKEVMSSSNLQRVTFMLFDLKLRDPELCHELAALLSFHLSEKHKLEYDFEEI